MSLLKLLTSGESLQRRSAERAAMPHVLLVVDQFPKTLGGGERIVLRLAALLPEYGYRASILTFSLHPQSRVCDSAPCPMYLLPLKRTYDLTALRAAFELRELLRRQSVGIVQTFFESSDIWAGFVTKHTSSARLIWSRRDMGILRSRKHDIAYRLMRDTPDAVLAVSDQVRRHSIEVDRISPGRVITVHNGLDLEQWTTMAQPHKPAGKFIITTVGNIRRVKGHDILLRAAALIVRRFPGAVFNIAGEVLDPGYFGELQALISELGIADHVSFAGGVTNLQEHLSAADLFVLPSRSEGFSNAIVEAMAASLPVIATSVGGNAEAVQDGVTGLIVPPEDASALAEAISRLLGDSVEMERMSLAGRKAVREKFTTAAMMERITKVYADVIAGTVESHVGRGSAR